MVACAPPSLHQLARAAARCATNAELFERFADARRPLPAPSPSPGCCLTKSPICHPFRDPLLASFFALLFRDVAANPLYPVRLSRFDLHHGHLFASPYPPALGLLLHSQEYPRHDEEDPTSFPFYLGRCQEGSDLEFVPARFDRRNFLWLLGSESETEPGGAEPAPDAGSLWCLDVGEGTPLHERLLHPYALEGRTVYEEDLGTPLADVYLLQERACGGGAEAEPLVSFY
eukprot:tig00020904_g15224.t1